MGNKQSSQPQQYKTLLQDYTILPSSTQKISYLTHLHTKQQYLLRTFTFSQQQLYHTQYQLLKKRREILDDNEHCVKINKIINNRCQEYCMKIYKIYVVLEYPHRNLGDQIEERKKRKLKFNQKEIWSILASCILGLSHMQKNQIKYSGLTTKSILFTTDGLIKLYDPHILGQRSNLQVVYQQRKSKNIYISPQQIKLLNQDNQTALYNTFKSDIWVLGLIMLQISLLNPMNECYNQEYSSINYQTINFYLEQMKTYYSQQLVHFIELMLIKQQKDRSTFIELENIMNRQDQNQNKSILNQIKSFQDLFIQSKCTDNQKTVTSVIPTQTLLSDRQVEMFHPLFSIEQSSIVACQRYESTLTRSFSNNGVSTSNINHTRPLRSFFPSNDQNLKLIQQYQQITSNQLKVYPLQDSLKSSLIINQNYNNLNTIYQITSKQSNELDSSKYNLITSPIKTSQYYPLKSIPEQSLQQTLSQTLQYITQYYHEGDKYQGSKLNKLKHGTGIYTFTDGGRYQGDWFMDKMQGNGKLYYQNGQLAYQGQWYNDKFLGKGILYNDTTEVCRDGFNYRNFDEVQDYWIKYQGQFIDDMKNGWGRLYITNGQIYQGYFHNDFIHGEGQYTTINGGRIKGRWDHNIMV